MPKNIPVALATALASSHLTMCFLMRIEPRDSSLPTYGVTTLDRDVAYDDGRGELTYSAAVGMVPSTFIETADLAVNANEAESLFPEYDIPVDDADIRAGAYDFARVDVYRVDYTNLAGGHIHVFRGTLGRINVLERGLSFVQELRGLAQALLQSITEKWSISCRAKFGSLPLGTIGAAVTERFPCNFDVEPLWEAGTVDAVGLESSQTFSTSGLAPTYGGNPGLVRWLTGANAGRENEVDTFDDVAGVITIGLTFPAMFPIQAGDTFEFRDDCPKTKAACKARSNWQHFRGEPHIPVGDAGAIATPGASAGIGTGGRLSVTDNTDPV